MIDKVTKDNDYIIRLKNIVKSFDTVIVNKKISLNIKKSEIRAILGENGAGKSTLMNIIYGLYQPDEGEIFIKSKHIKIKNSAIAITNGIGMIHQHFMLIKNFTVLDNLILGNEPTNRFIIDYKKAKQDLTNLMNKYQIFVPLDKLISEICVGIQQKVEILKVLYRGAEIIILDEPTAVLTLEEIDSLLKTVKNLANQGKTIIMITHKLKEVKTIANKCTVIRLGKKIGTYDLTQISSEELAEKMVGHKIVMSLNNHSKNLSKAKNVVKISNLTSKKDNLSLINNVNFNIRQGEIFGLIGVDGNGQSQLVDSILSLRSYTGDIEIDNQNINSLNTKQILDLGLSLIPEDRHKQGLIMNFSLYDNFILSTYNWVNFSNYGLLKYKTVKSETQKQIENFDVRPTDCRKLIYQLSGGNQQKFIISREIYKNPKFLIAYQPTRGLDLGAVNFVYRTLLKQKKNNKAILLVSLDLEEIMTLSDRIAVIYKGEILQILDGKTANKSEIGMLMAGGKIA